jgi:hypothetical protein
MNLILLEKDETIKTYKDDRQEPHAYLTAVLENSAANTYAIRYSAEVKNKITDILSELKIVDMLACVDGCDNMISLILATTPVKWRDSVYNTVRTTKYDKLNNNIINLSRSFDAFEGVHIGCVSASDIEFVTLYAEFSIPVSINNSIDPIQEIIDGMSPVDYYNKLCYNHFHSPVEISENKIDVSIDIKTIIEPNSKFVKFFDIPLLLCAEAVNKFFVKISLKTGNDKSIVGLQYLTMTSQIRSEIVKNFL